MRDCFENSSSTEKIDEKDEGQKNGSSALDFHSGGLAIEPLRKSLNKLSYGEGVDGILLNK